MSTENLFEKASRLKLRFDTTKGLQSASVDDLWDLPLESAKGTSLDSIAIDLDLTLKAKATKSFVNTAPKPDTRLQVSLDVVTYIIGVLKVEKADRVNAANRKAHNEKIDALIERRKEEKLDSLSLEELEAMRITA